MSDATAQVGASVRDVTDAPADVWYAFAEEIESRTGPDPDLDRRLVEATWPGCSTVRRRRGGPSVVVGDVPKPYAGVPVPRLTESVDAMRALFVVAFPGWWVSSGICGVSGHASCGPDYNGLHGDRLRREFPIRRYDAGFHADLEPGYDHWREALALAHVYVQARLSVLVPPAGEDAD